MSKIIDLSRIIENEMPVYPGDQATTIKQLATVESDGYNAYSFNSGMHTGTHIDIPRHFFNNNKFMSDYPIERFIGKAKVFDVSQVSQINYNDSYDKLITKDDIILFYTGFSEYYKEPKYYYEHPIISQELADFLVQRQVKLVGLDTPSPDFQPYSIHKTLLSNNIFIIENLCNLEKLLPYSEIEIIALPLKIKAEASPVRVVGKIIDLD